VGDLAKNLGFQSGSVQIKTHTVLNELFRYRVDVVLSREVAPANSEVAVFTEVNDELWACLKAGDQGVVRLKAYPHTHFDETICLVLQERVAPDLSWEALQQMAETIRIQSLQQLIEKARERGYQTAVVRVPGAPDLVCDLVFYCGRDFVFSSALSSTVDTRSATNHPLYNRARAQLVPQLKDYLAQSLPDYMVPASMIALDEWPRTPTGKVDRKALPQPQSYGSTQQVRRAPGTPTEVLVAKVWQRLLDLPTLGADSHFFALGGHSLIAMRVIAELRELTGKDIEPRALFAHPILEDFAAWLDERRDAEDDEALPIPRREGYPDAPAPLSPAQQRLWLLQQMQGEGRAYHVPIRLVFRGNLNALAFQEALQALVARHDQLRVQMHAVEGQPQQQLRADVQVKANWLNFQHLGASKAHEAAVDASQEEADQEFDLAIAPLFRVTVAEITDQELQLWLTFHHAIVDGWSLAVVGRDLAALYNSILQGVEPDLPALDLQYADVAAFLCDQDERLEQQRHYWMNHLKGMPHALKLPRTLGGSWDDTKAEVIDFDVDATLHRRMVALQDAHGVTPFMAYLAVFQVLLAKYGCGTDLPIATPHAGRDQRALENMVGFFVNTLVLRGDLSGNPSFLELLARSRALALAAFANRDLPFDKVVEALQPDRLHGSNPLTQVLFALQNTPGSEFALEGLELLETQQDMRHVRFDLELHMWASQAGMRGQFIYRRAQFDDDTMDRMVSHFQHLLAEIVRQPERAVLSQPIMNRTEQAGALQLGMAKPQVIMGNTIHGFFEQRVLEVPNKIAVVCPLSGERLTYAELNKQATQLAAQLQALGAGPEQGVAFFMERNAQLMVVLLGILKTGAFYVPLDPAYESERNRAILEDAQVQLMVTQRDLVPHFEFTGQLVLLEDIKQDLLFSPPLIDKQNLAYLIYTSGSTGKPKGVAVTHGVTVTMLNWARQCFSAVEREAVAGVSSVCFDMSILELFGAISWGGTLVLLPDALSLLELDESVAISHINTVPSVMEELTQRGLPREATLLVTLGGEPLTASLVNQIEEANPAVRIVNMFGPAEDGYTSWTDVSSDQEPDLGRPIHNTRMYVLDAQLEPVPSLVGGEICLAGDGTARGYFGKPDLTAEKFLPDPYGTPGSRMYRSGDLGKWDQNDLLRYLGRSDHQVKIRGFRVEPGEVESLLAFHPEVSGVVVLAHRQDPDAALQLVAFVVPSSADTGIETRLFEYLRSKLPSYMVPAHIELLANLPRNPNGKIDRARLSKMPLQAEERGSQEISFNEVQERVAKLWSEVLGQEQVGLADNFFDLGGHSLLMLRLRDLLEQHFERKVPLTELFRLPTVQQQAEFLEQTEVFEEEPQEQVATDDVPEAADEIAVVGFAGRFPRAENVAALWQNLCEGVDAVEFLDDATCIEAGADPRDLESPSYVKAHMPFEDYEAFDHSFFGYSRKEALHLDPQHRHFLEVCWLTLQHAGLDVSKQPNVGVFAGCDPNYYFLEKLLTPDQSDAAATAFRNMIGNDKDYLATRVAYKLDLKGPALTVQTACSTSLSAVHLACRAIRDGECRAALAGGVSIAPPNLRGYRYEEGMIHSRDGHCRAFDAEAAGTMGGQGAASVLLMSMQEARRLGLHVYAVIRGSAMNNDGNAKVGYTAPGLDGQADVIYRALREARVPPESIGYVEAHGTGTPLGDPIEIAALQKAYRQAGWRGPSVTRIGSLKTNIGHLGAAAGVSGLIKAVLCLSNRTFVPSLHYRESNPEIDFAKGPFQVAQNTEHWPEAATARRAAVSAFGIGGTNVHVILEEGVNAPSEEDSADQFGFPLSAYDSEQLLQRANDLADVFNDEHAAGMAWQLQDGFNGLPERIFLRREHLEPGASSYRQWPKPSRANPACKVAFVFPGIHAQYVGAAKPWCAQSSVFTEALNQVCQAFSNLIDFDVQAVLMGERAIAKPVELCDHVANFSFAYAASRFWQHLGIQPDVVLGQSFGEWPAAVIAGYMDLETAVKLVVARGKAVAASPEGAMLLVSSDEETLQPLLNGSQVVVGAVNARDRVVIGGPKAAVMEMRRTLKVHGIASTKLPVEKAYHHILLTEAAAAFRVVLDRQLGIVSSSNTVPMISTLTGKMLLSQQATPDYWQRQMLEPVALSDALDTLSSHADVFLEIGPDGSFTRALKRYWQEGDVTLIGPSGRRPDVAEIMGKLWVCGLNPNWRAAGSIAAPKPVPAYPFRKVLLAPHRTRTPLAQPMTAPIPELMMRAEGDVVRLAVQKLLGESGVGEEENLFDAGFDSLMMVELLGQLGHEKSLTLASVLEHPTIAGIREKLEPRRPVVNLNRPTPNLIPLSRTHHAPPLYLIHPIGGSAMIYRDLAKHLPQFAVIGCHAPGLVPHQAPVSDFNVLVDHYLQQILDHQPNGTYSLGGASFGGMLAFAVAVKLQQQGKHVKHLIMLDVLGPQNVADVWAPQHLFQEGKVSLERLRQVAQENTWASQWLSPDQQATTIPEPVLEVLAAHIEAIHQFNAAAFRGQLHFFRAKERLNLPAHPELEWYDLADAVTIRNVPGNHFDMVLGHHAEHLARAITSCMEGLC
jgi:amino acid adenylation domain-containing protein